MTDTKFDRAVMNSLLQACEAAGINPDILAAYSQAKCLVDQAMDTQKELGDSGVLGCDLRHVRQAIR